MMKDMTGGGVAHPSAMERRNHQQRPVAAAHQYACPTLCVENIAVNALCSADANSVHLSRQR